MIVVTGGAGMIGSRIIRKTKLIKNEKIPGLSCFKLASNSSLNLYPGSPAPVPKGQPP